MTREFFKKELERMWDSGVGIAAMRYEVTPQIIAAADEGSWQYSRLNNVIDAYNRSTCFGADRIPAFALYLPTAKLSPADLRSDGGKALIYAAIASFYCRVPKYAWARYDEKPIVFLGGLSGKQPDLLLFDFLQTHFLADFETGLYIVKDREALDTAVIDPEADHLTTALRNDELTFDQVQQEILSRDEFYHQSGDTPDGFLKNLAWKLFQERNDSPSFGVAIGSVENEEDRKKFLQRVFKSKKLREINAFWLSVWYKQFLEPDEPFADVKHRALGSSLQGPAKWQKLLDAGVHYDLVRNQLLASDEFFEKAGGSAEVFLHRLYETVGLSCSLKNEIKDWKSFLELRGVDLTSRSGLTRDLRVETAARFLPKVRQADVGLFFAHFLHRGPGWPGFADSAFSEKGGECPQYSGVASIGTSAVMTRVDNNAYRDSWKKVLSMSPLPSLVLLLSWNNFTAADENRDLHFGQQFLEMTRQYAQQYAGSGNFVSGGSCP